MSPAGWERFDAGADIGVRGWGASRAEAFGQVTAGVFALLVAPEAVLPGEQREVRAQADGPERLLGAWIEECLYVHEIEGFVAKSVEMTVCTDTLAHGVLHGEPLDPVRHRLQGVVRGAGGAQVAVEARHDVCETRVVMRRHGDSVS
jgi:SHS2 domain-containing protein